MYIIYIYLKKEYINTYILLLLKIVFILKYTPIYIYIEYIELD